MEPLSPSIPDSIIDYTNITENTSTYDDINHVSSSVYKSSNYDPEIYSDEFNVIIIIHH